MSTNFGDPEIVSGTRATPFSNEYGISGNEPAKPSSDGRVGPRDRPLSEIRAEALRARSRGLPVYQSETSRLRIQITSPREFVDGNGRARQLPGLCAVFNHGLYVPVSRLRPGTPEHKAEIATIIDALDSHPKFVSSEAIRKGGMPMKGAFFWKAEDLILAARERRYRAAAEALSSDPELKERFLEKITEQEMQAAVERVQRRRKAMKDAAAGVANDDEPAQRKARHTVAVEAAERIRDKQARRLRREAEAADVEEESESEAEIEAALRRELEDEPARKPPKKKKKKSKSKRRGRARRRVPLEL